MANFFIDLSGIGDGFGNFIAKQTAISLPEPMDKAFHGRFGHAERVGKSGIGDVLALGSQTWAQRLKRAQAALAFALFAQASKRVLDHRGSPAQIEQLFGRPRFQRLRRNRELRRRFGHPVVPRNELQIAATFVRVLFLRRVV